MARLLTLVAPSALLEGAPRDPAWLLEPFAVRGSAIMLYGRQGAGKSTLLLQLAHALATGTPWLGFATAPPSGAAAYINLDMPQEEFRALLARARDAGVTDEGLLVTSEQVEFNVMRLRDREELASVLTAADVHHVVVDTAPRTFEPAGGDVNAEVRRAVTLLQGLAPEGLLAFSQHDRKRGVYQKADDFEADPDAFSGPAAWEATVTTSFRLTDREGKPKLWLQKHRLADPGFRYLELARDEFGFFRAKPHYAIALRSWPRMVPPKERFVPSSLKDVFEDVARRANIDWKTVERYFYRTRKDGVYYGWAEELVKKGASNENEPLQATDTD